MKSWMLTAAAVLAAWGSACKTHGGAAAAGPEGNDEIKKRVAVHPLDPLTHAEIEAAVEVLKSSGTFAEGMFLPILVLHEPSKEAVKAFRPGAELSREAFAVVLDRK